MSVLRIILSFTVLSLLASCEIVEKPAIGGKGPLGLEISKGLSAPDYHNPKKIWMARHMDELNSGKYKTQECFVCHQHPDNFCNKCHDYIGAKKIIAVN
ncbi:MAG: hypothetical protein LLF28_05075 [Nitrospiraceae bacterium]|nr:hypothetical protein [Nitrospiraceae bacterium]